MDKNKGGITMEKYPADWKLLSASANAILPSRLSILWHYIIRRKPLQYTLEAWVHSPDKIGEMTLRIVWRNEVYHPQGRYYNE